MSRDDFSTGHGWQDEWDDEEHVEEQPSTRPLAPRRDPRSRAGQPGQRIRRASLPPDTYRDSSGRLRRTRQNKPDSQRPPMQGRPAQPRTTGAPGHNAPRPPAPRPTRDFQGEYDEYDAYQQQRPRQRPSQGPPPRPQSPQRARQPIYRHTGHDDGYDEAGEYYDAPSDARKRSGAQLRRRGIGSTLLIGCFGGIITVGIIVAILLVLLSRTLPGILPGLGIGTSAFSDKPQSVPLIIGSSITRIEIQNAVGDVTISVDANATNGTLTYTKKTQSSSSSSASAEYARISVTAKAGGSTATCPASSCIAITTIFPSSGGDSVDMNIVLPPQNPTPVFTISSVTQKGKVTVQDFRGLLSLTDDTGNIDVKGGLLAAGSCLQSRIGSVSFAETLETTVAPTINPCYGNTISTPPGNSNNQPWYVIKTGTGNVDATFNTLSTNLMLDVTIGNKGAIKGDFNLNITQNPDGTSNYFGPLLPNSQPTAFLKMLVSVEGTITLHKAAS